MRKLDLILENIKDEYMINLLEEGTASELEALKTKKFLNENLSRIRAMLVEEGAMDSVKGHLANNWGKYLAGAGTAAAMAAGQDSIADTVETGIDNVAAYTGENPVANAAGNIAGGATEMATNAATAATEGGIQLFNAAGEAVNNAGQVLGDAYARADHAVGGILPGGQTPAEFKVAAADDAAQAVQGYQS